MRAAFPIKEKLGRYSCLLRDQKFPSGEGLISFENLEVFKSPSAS